MSTYQEYSNLQTSEDLQPKDKESWLDYIYFSLLGMIGLAPFFAVVSETDFFNKKYPRFLLNIYIIMPTNIAAFASLLLNMIFSKWSINKKIIFSTIVFTFCIATIPIFPIFFPDQVWSNLSF